MNRFTSPNTKMLLFRDYGDMHCIKHIQGNNQVNRVRQDWSYLGRLSYERQHVHLFSSVKNLSRVRRFYVPLPVKYARGTSNQCNSATRRNVLMIF